jgi:hypothetical protein
MAEKRIIPRYKMLLSYDVRPENLDSYYQFVMGEFVPAVQDMGLYMLEAWHTAYGPYPIRLIGFVAEELDTVNDALDSDEFQGLEDKLMNFITNYTRRIVPFREGFQFIETEANGH